VLHLITSGARVRRIVCATLALVWLICWATLPSYSSGQPVESASPGNGRAFSFPAPNPATECPILPGASPLLEFNSALPAATQTVLSPLADSRVKSSSTTSNYGTDTDLRTRLSSSSSNYESYLKFDLSTLPSSISNAKLQLYGHLDDTSSINVPTAAFAVSNTTWTETGITWSNKPASATSPLATVIVPDAVARFYEWDITSYIQSEKSAGRNVVSLALKPTGTSSPYTIFNSKEPAATARSLSLHWMVRLLLQPQRQRQQPLPARRNLFQLWLTRA
jgi:hypothetical protein